MVPAAIMKIPTADLPTAELPIAVIQMAHAAVMKTLTGLQDVSKILTAHADTIRIPTDLQDVTTTMTARADISAKDPVMKTALQAVIIQMVPVAVMKTPTARVAVMKTPTARAAAIMMKNLQGVLITPTAHIPSAQTVLQKPPANPKSRNHTATIHSALQETAAMIPNSSGTKTKTNHSLFVVDAFSPFSPFSRVSRVLLFTF